MQSTRHDGRGHWPANKRRHADAGRWSRTRLTLTRFLDEHLTPDEISQRQLGRDLGVSQRTVGRWLRGEDRPPEELQDAIQQWLREWREELQRRRSAA